MTKTHVNAGRVSVLLILGVLISILFVSCESEVSLTTDRVKVSEVALEELPGGARILTGYLENLSDEEILIAQIQFSLFDADNRGVDSMGIVVRSVPAGGRVFFREAVQSDFDTRGVRPKSVLLP